MSEVNTILIAGAGIGGLSAALALVQVGFNVTVLEQAPQLGEVGAGLQISPNALKVLQKLGVDKALSQYAFAPQNATMRHFKTGEYYLKMPLGETAVNRYGAAYWSLHRADLHKVLADACEEAGVTMILNAKVAGYQQNLTQVTLLLQDKREFKADLLIGADGIRSRIREQMLGRENPTFMGQVAWRGVIPVSELKGIFIQPDACVWVGPNRHFVSYYLRGGEYVNFVAVEERSDWRSESWREAGDVEALKHAFADWHPEVSKLLQFANRSFLWALNGRDELPRWYQQRVVLLGDACHPMLPFMAQGAAMAIEDAYVLAQSLLQGSLAEALLRYETARKPRATQLQQMSKDNAALYHMQGGWFGKMKLKAIRMASQHMPKAIQTKLDPVYGYDVTR